MRSSKAVTFFSSLGLGGSFGGPLAGAAGLVARGGGGRGGVGFEELMDPDRVAMRWVRCIGPGFERGRRWRGV
jgi:hypothetical protein